MLIYNHLKVVDRTSSEHFYSADPYQSSPLKMTKKCQLRNIDRAFFFLISENKRIILTKQRFVQPRKSESREECWDETAFIVLRAPADETIIGCAKPATAMKMIGSGLKWWGRSWWCTSGRNMDWDFKFILLSRKFSFFLTLVMAISAFTNQCSQLANKLINFNLQQLTQKVTWLWSHVGIMWRCKIAELLTGSCQCHQSVMYQSWMFMSQRAISGE